MIEALTGVDIERYSAFPGDEAEAEVLLFPGTKLLVVGAMDMGNGLYCVHLREIALPAGVQLMK